MKFADSVVVCDDGSTDNTLSILEKDINNISGWKIINLYRNYGKSIALQAGFDIAQGSIVATIDGDLQDNPREIKNLINHLNKGHDLVCGWKKSRKDSLEKMNRVLDDGGILGLVSDQDAKNRGVFVRFFNILSSTPKGAAQFYQHKGSVPIFGVCSKEGHNQFLIKFKPIPKGSLADTETFTQAYTQLLENEIRIHPEQYFWWHNRWKTSPQEK